MTFKSIQGRWDGALAKAQSIVSQVSEDATFQDVIYTIKLDINQNTGQTRQEIILDLN